MVQSFLRRWMRAAEWAPAAALVEPDRREHDTSQVPEVPREYWPRPLTSEDVHAVGTLCRVRFHRDVSQPALVRSASSRARRLSLRQSSGARAAESSALREKIAQTAVDQARRVGDSSLTGSGTPAGGQGTTFKPPRRPATRIGSSIRRLRKARNDKDTDEPSPNPLLLAARRRPRPD